MKKLTRILSLLMAAVMLCAVLVSCAGKPNEDPKEAKKALKEADYIVELEETTLFNGAEYMLVGMKMGDWDLSLQDLMTMDDEECEELLEEMEGETLSIELVVVIYFESEDDAEDAFDEAEEYLENAVESLTNIFENAEETDFSEYDITVEFEPGEVTLDGCMVYIGTPGALKDAA